MDGSHIYLGAPQVPYALPAGPLNWEPLEHNSTSVTSGSNNTCFLLFLLAAISCINYFQQLSYQELDEV